MTPSFSISVGGSDITGSLNDRLVSLMVSDAEGFTSDSVEIELDDRDGSLEIPKKGAKLAVSMGYKEAGMTFMGLFVVDEVEANGFPQMLSIRGKAADMREDLKKPRTGFWDNKTLKDIVGDIASRNGLSGKVSESLSSFKYPYLPQTEESDLHFLTRLARKHDAIAKPANGKMLFVKKGEGGMGLRGVSRSQVIEYNCQLRDRPAVKKAIGTWWDQKNAKRQRVEKQSDAEVGPDFEMLHSQPGEDEAGADAQSTADAQSRDAGSLNLTIIGDPAYAAEIIVMVRGLRTGVDGPWRVKTAEHRLDAGGYVTTLSCEFPTPEGKSSDDDGSNGAGGGTGKSTGGVPGGTGEDSVAPEDLDFGGYGTPEH